MPNQILLPILGNSNFCITYYLLQQQEQQQKKEELERRLHDVQSKLGNDAGTKTGERKKGAKHAAKGLSSGGNALHNTSNNSKGRNSSSSSGSDSSDSSGSSSDDSDSESDNSEGDQKKSKKLDQKNLLGSNGSSTSNTNNSQLKGTASLNSAQAGVAAKNSLQVRNDLMPGSTANQGNNEKQNPYQGNNSLQNSAATKSPGSALLASSLQKEDSPGSADGHHTKTKAMLKGIK